jgi:hypothetical protein
MINKALSVAVTCRLTFGDIADITVHGISTGSIDPVVIGYFTGLSADITSSIAGIVIGMLASGSAGHLIGIAANRATIALDAFLTTGGILHENALILMLGR